MPQDDIAGQWASFDDAKRKRLLGKMSPEDKKKLRGLLEAKPRDIPSTPASALSRFGKSYASGAGVVSNEEGYNFFRHPIDTAKGMLEAQGELGARAGRELKSGDYVRGATHGIEYLLPGIGPTLAHAGDQLENKDYAGGVGTTLGVGTTIVADPERITGKVKSALKTPGELKAKMQPFARKVTGVESAVKEEVGNVAEKHGETLAKRPAELKEHFNKTQEVKTANEEAAGAQSRKGAIDSGVEKMSTELGSEINELDKKVRGEANEKYAAVREKVGDATVPHEGLVQSVKNAEGKLQGSAESIKVFRDIMGKAGDDVVVSGGKEFGPGTTLYESVKASPEGIPNASAPVSFADLQGYYSELGDKLSGGNLPGDVYQAMKGLREDIGSQMSKLAESRGAGAELAEAQKFYHDYMDTFRENAGPSGSGSPVAQARLAKDPAFVRKPFTGESGNRGVEMLAKYSPDLAKKARSIAKYQSEADAIPGRAPKVKEAPAMPAKPTTPTVDVSKVAREAIAKRAKNWGAFNARDIGILSSGVMGELIGSIFGSGTIDRLLGAATGVGAYEGGKYLASRALNKPAVIEWLSKTPPEEAAAIAKIPGADKIKIVDGLTQLAVDSGKPVTLSPAARALLGPANVARIMVVSAPKTPGEARDRIRPNAPTPVAQ